MTTPFYRPRRLRGTAALRNAIAEVNVRPENLMLPVFVADVATSQPIQGMPGVEQHPVARLVQEVEGLVERGLKSFLVFGVPSHKDAAASAATADDGIVPRAVAALKRAVGDAAIIATDVCVCAYTDHGHCGVIHLGRLDNDRSIELLSRMALAHARAGADMVAPSDMMDGRVRRIREVLDSEQLSHVPIMSYAVKYASSLYGPFRHAQASSPKSGDRRGYQMDVRNRREAVREALLDVDEGADILMVKPGLAYLDILAELRRKTTLPLAAYQVSGEYAMIRYAAQAGAIDERAVTLETWIAMRRAGANLVLTYHAAQAVRERWLEA